MENTKGQRLNKFVKSIGITQDELALLLKRKTRAAISNWVRDNQDIPDLAIVEILKLYPKINADWFINNRGPMLANTMDVAYEPQPPYDTKLTKSEKENYEQRIVTLENTVASLTQLLVEAQRGGCAQGELEGGVEKPGKAV